MLAKEGLSKEFEVASNECRKHFNIQLAEFSTPTGDADTLESFERISSQLQKIWGTPEAVDFLDELIYNTRMEPRMGFDKTIFEELILLREIAEYEIKVADEIRFESDTATPELASKEKVFRLNLPEIKVSDEFKHLSGELTLVADARTKLEANDAEHFEFELLDIAHR